MFSLRFFGRFREFGLFLLRAGLGFMFIIHGSSKIFAGPETWSQVGGAMANWGITMWPTFWGFMAAFAEFGGGIFFILGFLFRPAAILLTITMAVAATMHIQMDGLMTLKGFSSYSHAVELGIVFFSLIFIGPGKLSIDGD